MIIIIVFGWFIVTIMYMLLRLISNECDLPTVFIVIIFIPFLYVFFLLFLSLLSIYVYDGTYVLLCLLFFSLFAFFAKLRLYWNKLQCMFSTLKIFNVFNNLWFLLKFNLFDFQASQLFAVHLPLTLTVLLKLHARLPQQPRLYFRVNQRLKWKR